MDEPRGSELGRLHQAAVSGQVTLVKCLLCGGASANATDDSNQTALHLVSESDSKYSQKVVDVLVEYGATVDARTKWGSTPLHWACWLGNKDVAEALLRHNARTDIVDGECMTPLHALAISKTFHASLIDSLLERGASVNAKDSSWRTPLHYFSCRPGKTYAVLAILNKDGNANLQDLKGNTPLHLACQSNLREVVSLLLERSARVEVRNRDGMTALHLAALRSSEDVLDVLLDNGADVNAQDYRGNTPLHLVCSVSDTLLDHINSSQRFTFVQKLLKKGVRVDLKNELLRTACDESVTAVQRLSDCTSMFKLTARLKIKNLMKQEMFKQEMSKPQDEEDLTSTASCSFDVFNHPESIIDMFDPAQSIFSHNTQNDATPSCKILALKQPDYLVWRDLLLYFCQCLHSANPSYTSSLVCPRTRTSCERSYIMISQLLQSRRRWKMMKKLPFPKTIVNHIKEMNEPRDSELGRLHQAVVSGQETLVRCLLGKGASANATDDSNQTALHLVSESDSKYSQKVVDVLVEYGATLDARTKWGSTPLHWACWLGNKDVAEALLRHNARTDIVDGECMTPLHALAISKIFHASLIDSLLERGASVNAKDSSWRTPLHYFSCRPGKTYAVLAILNKDGNANLQDLKENTPLHLACQSNLREVVSLLLERGARVEVRNRDGMTALHLAALRSSEDVLDVLLDNGADVNAQDYRGNTPLHHVCSVSDTRLDHINSYQRLTFVQKLLKKGVRVDLKNELLRTACDESLTAVQRLSDCTKSMFKLTARLKIANLMKQEMFKQEMSKSQDEENLTSTASCSFYVFYHPESIIDIFDRAQGKCIHNTQNAGTLSCKILALKQPDYVVWRDLLLYFSQCLHSANLSHTSSLVCFRTRITYERSKIMISQLLQSRRRWKMMMKLPFSKTVIAMVFLYSKSHQISKRNKSIENY